MNPFASQALYGQGADVFRTQADNRFNTFADPLNSVNMNQSAGPWGVNPAYLTPAYLSPFRPPYSGPETHPATNPYNPSWMTSANQVFNPFAGGGVNYGGNANAQVSPFYDRLFQRPVDHVASFAQNWVVPGVATWGAWKAFGGIGKSVGRGLGSGFGQGVASAFSAGAPATRLMMKGLGGLGGFLGSTFLPAIPAEAAIQTFNRGIAEPYVAQRMTYNAMRTNFGGVTFGEAGAGDPYTGGGLSRRTAAAIASNVSQATAADMTFTQKEGSMIGDYAARSGLLDNAQASQIGPRIQSIMKQVKLVMSIANTSEVKEAIEALAKLQMAGASGLAASSALGSMGANAAIAGRSVSRLMNTVGAQGQYLFGAAGLTPYLGQMSAFGATASMAAAYRSGLVSPALMARMGGVDGAAQTGVAAQIAAFSTPYANAVAANRYMGGGAGSSLVGNMSRFGGMLATDTVNRAGMLDATAGALASRHIQDQGLTWEIDQIHQHAAAAGLLRTRQDGSTYVPDGTAFHIMTTKLGLSPDMARQRLIEFAGTKDRSVLDTKEAGIGRASMDAMMKYRQQESLDKGILTPPLNLIKRVGMQFQEAGARAVGGFLEDVGSMSDATQNWFMSSMLGSDLQNVAPTMIDGSGSPSRLLNTDGFNLWSKQSDELKKAGGGMLGIYKKGASPLNLFDFGRKIPLMSGDARRDMEKINALAKQGNSSASKFLDPASTAKDKKDALWEMRGALSGGDYTDPAVADMMLKYSDMAGTQSARHFDTRSLKLGEGPHGVDKDTMRLVPRATAIAHLDAINDLADAGNADANRYLDSTLSKEERGKALQALQSKIPGADYSSPAKVSALMAYETVAPITGPLAAPRDVPNLVTQKLKALSADGQLGLKASSDLLNTSDSVYRALSGEGRVNPELAQTFAKLSGKDVSKLSQAELRKAAGDVLAKAIDSGLGGLIGLNLEDDSQEGLAKAIKEQRGGVALLNGVKVGNDQDAAINQARAQAEFAQQKGKLRQLYNDKRIDGSEFMSANSALDNKESSRIFADAVNKFVGGVNQHNSQASGFPGIMSLIRGNDPRNQDGNQKSK